ncbi:peroxisomal biogenesis factor 19-like isoform X2 [Ornithodoros turicata]|uniref:peroxisomal biogenesis factor 19-like isoform X2 n=1 Tax=Ornithodoros turicata TaxID=34597 RepID=UPI0031386B1C
MADAGPSEGIKSDSTDDHVQATSQKVDLSGDVDDQQDEELDDLLDSALKDFENAPPSLGKKGEKKKDTNCLNTGTSSAEDHPWTAEFGQFADVMNSYLDQDPELKEQFSKIAATANRAATATTDEEFAATLNETMKSISDTAASLGDPPSQDELSTLMGSLNVDGCGISENGPMAGMPGIVSMMQNMMQNLLSKEMLYPALRDIVDKYPDWLAEKRPSLTSQDYDRFNKQYELMKQVCEEFEAEQPSDAPEVKKARFERVLNFMQKMQECGQPPKELVEISPELAMGEAGNFRVPGMPEQCCLM